MKLKKDCSSQLKPTLSSQTQTGYNPPSQKQSVIKKKWHSTEEEIGGKSLQKI